MNCWKEIVTKGAHDVVQLSCRLEFYYHISVLIWSIGETKNGREGHIFYSQILLHANYSSTDALIKNMGLFATTF